MRSWRTYLYSCTYKCYSHNQSKRMQNQCLKRIFIFVTQAFVELAGNQSNIVNDHLLWNKTTQLLILQHKVTNTIQHCNCINHKTHPVVRWNGCRREPRGTVDVCNQHFQVNMHLGGNSWITCVLQHHACNVKLCFVHRTSCFLYSSMVISIQLQCH